MISPWILIIGGIVLLFICFGIGFGVDSYYQNKADEAVNKLLDIDRLRVLKNTNESEFICEAEFILKHLENKRYSEFKKFQYGESKHGHGYYIVGYTSRFDSKRFFPHHNIMGDSMYPEHYLKTLDEVHKYYVDLLWRQLNYMLKEKNRLDEYDRRSEL